MIFCYYSNISAYVGTVVQYNTVIASVSDYNWEFLPLLGFCHDSYRSAPVLC